MNNIIKEFGPDDLSPRAQETLEFLGNFNPTIKAEDETMKGFMDGYKIYLNSVEFRDMAGDFLEIASWLERRAQIGDKNENN